MSRVPTPTTNSAVPKSGVATPSSPSRSGGSSQSARPSTPSSGSNGGKSAPPSSTGGGSKVAGGSGQSGGADRYHQQSSAHRFRSHDQKTDGRDGQPGKLPRARRSAPTHGLQRQRKNRRSRSDRSPHPEALQHRRRGHQRRVEGSGERRDAQRPEKSRRIDRSRDHQRRRRQQSR